MNNNVTFKEPPGLIRCYSCSGLVPAIQLFRSGGLLPCLILIISRSTKILSILNKLLIFNYIYCIISGSISRKDLDITLIKLSFFPI